MKILLKFLLSVASWTGILLVLLSAVSLFGGQELGEVLRHLPVWGGLSLVLSAFPAGIAVAGEVFPRRGGIDLRGFGSAIAGVGMLTAVTFVLVAYVGPALLGTAEAGNGLIAVDPSSLTLGELRAEAVRAVREIEAQVGNNGRSLGWLEANILGWHYHRRVAAVLQPPMFALIGLLLGFWGQRLPIPRLGRGLYWTVGLFLVMSTYLAGENSYELVALRAAGPVFFSGFFVLIIPPVLAAGLAIPTAVMLWAGEDGADG